jgi:hypothetical protein
LKTFIRTIIGLIGLLFIIYFSANHILQKLAVKVVAELKPKLEQKGIMVESFDYSNVQLVSYNSIAIINTNLDFHLNKKMYGKESFHAQFSASSINIRFADFENPSFFFKLNDFSLYIEPDEENTDKPFGRLNSGFIHSRIPVYMKNPEESAREILDEIKLLFAESKTPLDIEMHMDVLLGIDDREAEVGLFTERIDNLTYLRFNSADILDAARSFELDLTEKEAEIIARFPSKVPAMIKITRDAKRLSNYEKNMDGSFPEDAYRHVYWSYHLTREFGAELAKEITDAHETAPGNTQNERLMDFHNNELGRKLATGTLSETEIKNLVLKSKDVIRSADEIR